LNPHAHPRDQISVFIKPEFAVASYGHGASGWIALDEIASDILISTGYTKGSVERK
jgi:hypothetical protein